MTKSAVDFTWACSLTLNTFELRECKNLSSEIMNAMSAQLGSMLNLASTVIEQVTLETTPPEESKTEAPMKSMIKSP